MPAHQIWTTVILVGRRSLGLPGPTLRLCSPPSTRSLVTRTMAIKQFLQNLFERVGLAEMPMSPPNVADIAPAEARQLEPILLRLAAWGVRQVRLVVGDETDAGELMQAARRAVELGMEVGIRGLASDLVACNLISGLAAASVREVELPLLSAVAEVHDALAGMGDYRCVLKAWDALSAGKLTATSQLAPDAVYVENDRPNDGTSGRSRHAFGPRLGDCLPRRRAGELGAFGLGIGRSGQMDRSLRTARDARRLVSAAEVRSISDACPTGPPRPTGGAGCRENRGRREHHSTDRPLGSRRQRGAERLEIDRPQRSHSCLEAPPRCGRAV